MATDVVMPQMGESIFEGTITKWLKKAGEAVQKDEPLFEISTDKVDAEIPSPVSGILRDIKVQEGETVQINTVVAVVAEEAEEKPSASQAKQPPAAQETPPQKAPKAQSAPPQVAPEVRLARSFSPVKAASPPNDPRLSPATSSRGRWSWGSFAQAP